jgi:hypothetical protein
MIRDYGTAGSALCKLSGSVVSGSWSWRSGFHPKANVVAYHKCNRKNFKEKFWSWLKVSRPCLRESIQDMQDVKHLNFEAKYGCTTRSSDLAISRD